MDLSGLSTFLKMISCGRDGPLGWQQQQLLTGGLGHGLRVGVWRQTHCLQHWEIE